MEFNLDMVYIGMMLYVLAAVFVGAFLFDAYPRITGTCFAIAFAIIIIGIVPIEITTKSSTIYSIESLIASGFVKDDSGVYSILMDNVAVHPSTLVNGKKVDILFVNDDNIDIELRTHRYTENICNITLWQNQYEIVANKKYMIWDSPRGEY